MERDAQKRARNEILSDETEKTVIHEKQDIHNREGSAYIPGRSYLFPGVDAQELVDRYHGTGYVHIHEDGTWNKEVVIADGNIGMDVDHKTGRETLTNRLVIHYRRTGTHVVPIKRR